MDELSEPYTIEPNEDNVEKIPPHLLSDTGILLYTNPEDKPFPAVPPSSPKEMITDCYVTILPTIPDNLHNIKIPYVREIGVRDSICFLAKYFGCDNYENNLVQFWFLDFFVDCIWRAQDEFKFSSQHQKVMLEWILFVLKLITKNKMTKALMFQILNEAVLVAEEYIQSGGTDLPTPDNLFTLSLKIEKEDDKDEGDSATGTSLRSEDITNKSTQDVMIKPSKQFIVIKYEEKLEVFKLPNKEIPITECLSSSIEPPSEEKIQISESVELLNEQSSDTEQSTQFYKPDMSTPPRFKSLQQLLGSCDDIESTGQKEENNIGDWVNIPRKPTPTVCPDTVLTEQQEILSNHLKFEENEDKTNLNKAIEEPKEAVLDNEEIFKAFYDYNMWQLRNEYMIDPNIGWTPSLTSYKNVLFSKNLNGPSLSKSALKKLISQNKAQDEEREKDIFIKLCILMAVKQVVFEYFAYNFSFELIRTSLKYPQYLITQDLNETWYIPKEIKGDLKKPMPKKPKKEKAKKEKKDKKDKKEKKSKGKKDKKSKSSKSSKSKGKDKKDKKSKKSKSEKKSKSTKKSDKSPKISKEEKKEMERLRKQEEEIEKQKLKEEENKMFMFPLKEAVDDDFYTKIFPDYKPKKGGKGAKSDKSSKSSKSDKSDKKDKKDKKQKKDKKGKKK